MRPKNISHNVWAISFSTLIDIACILYELKKMLYLTSWTLIFFSITLFCLYIWVIRVIFSGFLSCREVKMCLGGTCLFVKSKTCCFSSEVNLPTNTWPLSLLGNPWLWTPHFTSTFHPNPSFDGVYLILYGHPHLLVALWVPLLSLYFPPLSHPKIILLLLPLLPVSVSERLIITVILFLNPTSLIQLVTSSRVVNVCIVVNTSVVSIEDSFFWQTETGISIPGKNKFKNAFRNPSETVNWTF